MTAATLTAGDLESVRYDFNSYWVMTRGYLVLTNKIMQNYQTALKISLPFIGRVLFWWKKHALFFYIYVKFTIVPLDYHCKTPVSLNSLEKTRHTHPRTQLRGNILKIALVNRFFRKTVDRKNWLRKMSTAAMQSGYWVSQSFGALRFSAQPLHWLNK